MTFYTYLHRRLDTNEVFYVGKGCRKRAHDRGGRSAHWKRVEAKAGRSVEVLAHWPTNQEAYDHEQFLIACFRDLGAPLVNTSDGGPGSTGCRPNDETRAKLRAAKVGRALPELHRRRIGASLAGRVVSAETRAKLAAAHVGREYLGRRGPRDPEIAARAARGIARLFADKTGRVQTAGEWAAELGVEVGTFYNRVCFGEFTNTRKRAIS